MQGVTELVRCERTADTWLTEVQEQLRYGALSQDNHAFLHGHGTSVPGSWTKGAPACCRSLCGALVGKSPEEIRQRECVTCRKERASRHLVACANDPRFYQDFAEATAIFATNDIKYHVNKRRAVRWAIEQKQMPHIAVARDVASATVLQDKPDLATEKLQWLQRHDQECGGLYGVLPLCIGLPVRATDHLDRQRGILKGCKGTVVGWCGWSSARDAVVGDGVTLWNTLPEIVYVRFQTTATWHLTGLPEANVYPVPTCKRVWFLDRQKKYPHLRVWRTQFPLAPGFAITAHVAQGQTVSEGVTTDLNIGLSGNPFTAYVAFIRVPGRDKLLLFRPFRAKLFQRGVGIGRELLLRVLRGESVNWRALLDAYCEERGCCICRERKQKDAYTRGQWKRNDDERVCRECVQDKATSGTPWQRNNCKVWHAEANFPKKYHRPLCTYYRVCLTCEVRKECANCGVRQAEAAFGAAAWKARHVDRRVCRACARKQRGWWQRHTCYVRKEPSQFSAWLAKRTAGQDGRQICNGCKALQVACRYAGRANHRLARLRARAAQNRVHDRLPALPADATASGSELERRRRLVAETWAEITARQGETTERTQKKRKTETPASDEKLYREVQAKKQHEYACPHCGGLVASNVTTGQIDHRTVCGNRFNVSDGRVKEQQKHKYTCPHCEGLVASNVLTGQIDHRTVCGNRFNVSDGRVKEQRKHEYMPALWGPGRQQCHDGTN